MAWSTNTDTGNYEFTTTEDVDGVTLTVTEVFDTSFNPISSSWDDGTNSSSIAEAVDDVTFDFNNDGSDTTETVIAETGSRTWTWDDNGTTVTETVQFTNYYSDDGNRTYLGGTEVQDGITTGYYGDNGTKTVASTSYSTSGAPTVTASNGGWEASAAALYGDGVNYMTDTWTSWNGTDETERTFFNSSGDKLGYSYTNIDTWNNGTTDVTNTSTNYHNANGEWLGHEYSNDQGEAGSNFESTVVKFESNGTTVTQAWQDLAAELTWLVDDASTHTFTFESNFGSGDTISVKVESGSNTYTIGEGSAATTVTETRKHLMSENWDHYGGMEVL